MFGDQQGGIICYSTIGLVIRLTDVEWAQKKIVMANDLSWLFKYRTIWRVNSELDIGAQQQIEYMSHYFPNGFE